MHILLLKKVMPTNISPDASEADPAFPVRETAGKKVEREF